MASTARAGYSVIHSRALARESARKDGDYLKADAIRKELSALGVRFDDGQHIFTTAQGQTGNYCLQRGVGFEDIQIMCLEREEARRDTKYQEADQIRQMLTDHGVTLDDRSHVFRMPNGAEGSYDLHRTGGAAQMQVRPPPPPAAPVVPPKNGYHSYGPVTAMQPVKLPPLVPYAPPEKKPAPFQAVAATPPSQARPVLLQHVPVRPVPVAPVPVPMVGGGGVGGGRGQNCKFQGYLETLKLCIEREEHRRDRDYAGADRLRSLLQQRGVALNDAMHTFSSSEWEGSYDLHVGITTREIQYVALEREEARRDTNYTRADTLRQWLAQQNVTLDDRAHSFTTSTGEVGSFDLYNWTPMGVPSDTGVPMEPWMKRPRR